MSTGRQTQQRVQAVADTSLAQVPTAGAPSAWGQCWSRGAQLQCCSACHETMVQFLCFNQTAAACGETSQQQLCLQPKQHSPARSRQELFAETAAPTTSSGSWVGAGHRCQLELAHAYAKCRAVPIFPAWPI